MKRTNSLALVFALAMVTAGPIGLVVRADDDAPATVLETDMGRMGKALQKVVRQAKDPAQNAATLTLLSDMEKACLDAKDQTPKMAATLPADKQPKFVADYRNLMLNLMRQILDLEDMIASGQNDKAPDAIKTIMDTMKAGHKEFRQPEKGG